jgi:hypothetical protein
VVSNASRGMGVCERFFCVRSPVQVEALRRTDPPFKESYRLSTNNIQQPGRREVLDRTGLSCHTGRGMLAGLNYIEQYRYSDGRATVFGC